MLERLVARIPALLLAGLVLLGVLTAVWGAREPGRLLATAPAAVLLVAYLRAGRRR